jgi:hypothetical protein
VATSSRLRTASGAYCSLRSSGRIAGVSVAASSGRTSVREPVTTARGVLAGTTTTVTTTLTTIAAPRAREAGITGAVTEDDASSATSVATRPRTVLRKRRKQLCSLISTTSLSCRLGVRACHVLGGDC